MDDPQLIRQQLLATALKEKIPVAVLDPTCQWTSSKDQAAVDAFNSIPKGKKESSGAIYQNENGEFCYSIPIPGKQDNFRFAVSKQPGLKFDGLYHTHPGDDEPGAPVGVFSPNDVATAEQLKKDSYIRIERDDEIRKFVPGVTPTKAYESSNKLRNSGAKTSRGELLAQAIRTAANK